MPFFGFPQYIQHKTCKKMRIYPVSTSLFTDIIHFPFLYPLKTSLDQTFSDVFRVYMLARNGLKHIMIESLYYTKKLKNYSCKKGSIRVDDMQTFAYVFLYFLFWNFCFWPGTITSSWRKSVHVLIKQKFIPLSWA